MKTNYFTIINILSIIGIFLASYLLYQYFAPAHKSLCYVNATINCEASSKGVLANTLGIPTGLYGLAGYFLILISSVKKWRKMVLFMSAFGFFFCLRITILELFVIKTICPVCVLCQIDMLALFLLAIYIYKKPLNLISG